MPTVCDFPLKKTSASRQKIAIGARFGDGQKSKILKRYSYSHTHRRTIRTRKFDELSAPMFEVQFNKSSIENLW